MECHLLPKEKDFKTIIILKEVNLGRCPDTGIKDLFLTKNQCSFKPDFINQELKVVQNGKLPSKVNGDNLNKGESAILKNDDIFMFLEDKYSYIVKFVSPDAEGTCLNKKRKILSENIGEIKKLKQTDVIQGNWDNYYHMVIFTPNDLKSSDKIASYDIDGTIIDTKSGKVFANDLNDWKIIYPEVKPCLQKLHEDGFKIVFFTNQKGIEKGKVKLSDFQAKVDNILKELSIPVQVFVSISSGIYRKPSIGMWDHLSNNMNENVTIDKKKSFYVGDAAGRPKDWIKGKKKDFSCADRLFAMNVGLKFETPEEHFLKQKAAKFNLPDFNPKSIENMTFKTSPSLLISKTKEMIVMVGFPGSGKSNFVKTYLIPAGYTHINRDTLKTWQLCVKKSKEALQLDKSVVIDNTNPDKESRQRFIQVAKEFSVPCRCFVMDVTFDHAKHNEKFREITDKSHDHVPDMVFNMYKSKFQPPDQSEGFDEIHKINFVPNFKNSSDKQLYTQYLSEK